MEDWQVRVCDEHNELRKKIMRLDDFLNRGGPPTDEERDILNKQIAAMNVYCSCLQTRINMF